MIGDRIKSVKERWSASSASARNAGARARGTFRVSLVGYTNAGKSTLFNAWSRRAAYAADQLFATLDTTTRQLWLEGRAGRSSLSDTVGFIRDLPHKLVEAFEATLQEAADADLLLHVVDAPARCSTSRWPRSSVCSARSVPGRFPQVLVFNKLDAPRAASVDTRLLRPTDRARERRPPPRVSSAPSTARAWPRWSAACSPRWPARCTRPEEPAKYPTRSCKPRQSAMSLR